MTRVAYRPAELGTLHATLEKRTELVVQVRLAVDVLSVLCVSRSVASKKHLAYCKEAAERLITGVIDELCSARRIVMRGSAVSMLTSLRRDPL